MTERLYYKDSYLTEFTAKIIRQEPYKEHFAIVLGQTAFYPEGGGQPTDLGFINDVPVIEVIEADGEILHILPSSIEIDAKAAGSVQCSIDWSRRFDLMQQHTGQHVLSACFAKLLDGETNSFHLGKETVSIEIGILDFSIGLAEEIEKMANEIIFQNIPITAYIVDPAKLSILPLRKHPKVTENIRIVQIGEIDYSPCGGTHVAATGQIGMIKIKRWEKCKDCYRFEFVCGYRALRDYQQKNTIVNNLGAKLSVQEYEVENSINKMLLDYRLEQKKYADLKQVLFRYEAEELLELGELIGKIKIISKIFDDRTINDAKIIAQYIIQQPSQIAILVCKGQNAQILLSRSDDVPYDMGQLLKKLIPIIDGKGGGNSKSAQGGGSNLMGIPLFIEEAINEIKKVFDEK